MDVAQPVFKKSGFQCKYLGTTTTTAVYKFAAVLSICTLHESCTSSRALSAGKIRRFNSQIHGLYSKNFPFSLVYFQNFYDLISAAKAFCHDVASSFCLTGKCNPIAPKIH